MVLQTIDCVTWTRKQLPKPIFNSNKYISSLRYVLLYTSGIISTALWYLKSFFSIWKCVSKTWVQIVSRSTNTEVMDPPGPGCVLKSPLLNGKWILKSSFGSNFKICNSSYLIVSCKIDTFTSFPITTSPSHFNHSPPLGPTTSGVALRLKAAICWGGVAYLLLPSDCKHDCKVCDTDSRASSNSWGWL
jgi:hypothetical protein